MYDLFFLLRGADEFSNQISTQSMLNSLHEITIPDLPTLSQLPTLAQLPTLLNIMNLLVEVFLHRQMFIVCFRKFSSFESQSGQPLKKCSAARSLKCTISKVNVRCRNFRDESVSTSKPSRKKKYIQNGPPKKIETLAGRALVFEWSQCLLMFHVFTQEAAIVVPTVS